MHLPVRDTLLMASVAQAAATGFLLGESIQQFENSNDAGYQKGDDGELEIAPVDCHGDWGRGTGDSGLCMLSQHTKVTAFCASAEPGADWHSH